jgi:hypothetical protein
MRYTGNAADLPLESSAVAVKQVPQTKKKYLFESMRGQALE